MVQQDSRTVAIRNILTRLSKRSGLSADRLRTTEIDVAPLLDLPVVKERAGREGISVEQAVLPVIRDLARQLAPTHRLIADAELSLGLLREKSPHGIDLARLYAADLGERREYLTAVWELLHRTVGADDITSPPSVRSLRATPERRAFTALAGQLVAASSYAGRSGYRFTPEPKVLVTLPDSQPQRGIVTVIGDSVIDHIYRIGQIPVAGKSTPGGFEMHAGGKGLNRAVAAARLGLQVRLVSAVGADDAGRYIRDYLETENVDIRLVKEVPGAQTQVTAVMITSTGTSSYISCKDERIRLGTHDPRDPEVRSALAASDAVLLTFEQPIDVVERTMAAIRALNPRPLLLVNATPAVESPQYLYGYLDTVDYLVGTTGELAKMLPGEDIGSAENIAQRLRMLGVRAVCVIDGFHCTVRSDAVNTRIADFPVALADSPGAAAAFSAALARQLVGTAGPVDQRVFRWATAAMVATQSFGDVPDAMPREHDIDRIVHIAADEPTTG
ncbi:MULTISPECIES: PfkB family carbohydrate kinase [unclassified Nocardia]|uniref:PfkB family carbohydrate kinase n=1 Tax=unclassified Nocardia TaxID=2637762 RepID=UPI003424850F